MAKRAKRAPKSSDTPLTPRQREWLRHLRACERSGGTIKAYAARQGLSVQSLYQAAKRLRRCGALEPRARRSAASAFVRVAATPRRREAESLWRVRLPSGAVFEATRPLGREELLALLDTLARTR